MTSPCAKPSWLVPAVCGKMVFTFCLFIMFSPVATDTDRCKLGSSEEAEDNTVVMAFPGTTIGPLPAQSQACSIATALPLREGQGLQGTARRPLPQTEGIKQGLPGFPTLLPQSGWLSEAGKPSTTKRCFPSLLSIRTTGRGRPQL